jgi:hypothetical protein
MTVGIFCIPPPEAPESKFINNSIETAFVTTFAISAPLLILGGDPYTAVTSFTSFQSLHFVLYYNVEYPRVLNNFLKSFGTIGNMKFLPNPIVWFVSFPKVSAPRNFEDGAYNSNFLANEGKSISLTFGLLGLYLLGITIGKVLAAVGVIAEGFMSISYYIPSLILRILIIFYMDIVVSSWLQIMNMDMTSTIEAVSGLIAVVNLILMGILPFWSMKILSTNPKMLRQMKKYEPLTEDFDVSKTSTKYFMVYILVKRFVFCTSLVVLYYGPIYKVLFAWLANTALMLMFIIMQPHHSLALNFFDTTQEFYFFLLHFSVMALAFCDKLGYTDGVMRDRLGYMIYCAVAGVAEFTFINIWRENLLTAHAIYLQIISLIHGGYSSFIRSTRIFSEKAVYMKKANVIRPLKKLKPSSVGLGPNFDLKYDL